MSEFNSLKKKMRRVDDTVREDITIDKEGPVLVSLKKCDELFDKYGNMQFTIHGTVMVIKPRGYLYPSLEGQKYCNIGI